MSIIIDMDAYKVYRDISLCIIKGKHESAVTDGYSTLHLHLMASQTRRIVYYPTKDGGWKTGCAFNIALAMKTGHYTLKRPEPGLIRLVVHEKPLFYIDLYFRKSFYATDKMREMLHHLIDETSARNSWICPTLLQDMGFDIAPIPDQRIDWSKVRMRPMDENLPPRFS
jgi:hypothetical protein